MREEDNVGVSLVFPAWNEQEYVKEAILKADEALKSFTDNYEIVLVDDGSKDKTGEIADSLANENKKIKVIHHKKNQKLGKTLRTGFRNASKELIFYSDIDLPFDFKRIPEVVSFLERTESDIVCCYRLGRFSKEPKRAIYSFFYNLLVKVLFLINVKDVNCPVKLFKKSVFDKVNLKSRGSFIDAELVIKGIKRGYKFSQMEIEYFPREKSESRASDFRVVLGILKEMMLLYKDTMFGR